MVIVRNIESCEKNKIKEIVKIHMETFDGFFLTFMGKGFLNQMYSSYCDYVESGVIVAEENDLVIGFLSFSGDFSGLYKHMIKSRLLQFAWYSLGAFFRKPTAFLHIVKAFLKPGEVKRNEKYVELSSIGVNPNEKSNGIGSLLINELKKQVDFNKYAYITLETDAVNNDAAIGFYEKNGFVQERLFETNEGRKMYEYRFVGDKI